MIRFVASGLAALTFVSAVPSVAFADSPAMGAPSPAPLASSLSGGAKADYDSAKLLYNDKDFATALVKFRRAFDASGDPRLLWNMAACEKALRHYTKALTLVERYETQSGGMLTADDKKEADALADALRATTDTLSLTANVSGADLLVDDENVAVTPLDHPIRVDLGDHKITVQKTGYAPFVKIVSFTGNGAKVDALLNVVEHVGLLRIDAEADDTIAVDGKLLASGATSVKLPSGPHTLSVSAKGKQTYDSDVTIQDGQTALVHVHLDKEKEGGVPTWAWIAGGAAIVAGGVVGTYFAVHSSKSDSTDSAASGTLGKLQLNGFRFGR